MTLRDLQAIETKKKILEAAYELFSKLPYDDVSMDMICEKSGISKGGIYHYFKSKDDIAVWCYRNYLEEQLEEQLNSFQDRDTVSLLIRYFDIMIDFSIERGAKWIRIFYRTLFGANIEKCTPLYEQNPYRKLYLIAENGLSRGELSNANSAAFYANLWLNLLHGIFMNWCLLDGNTDLRHDVREIIQYCCHVS